MRDEGWRIGNEIRYRLAQANRNSRREAMQGDCETPYKNRAILCRRRRRGAKRRLQHNAAGRHLLKPLPVTRHLLLTQMAQHSARAHFPFPIPHSQRSRVIARDDNKRRTANEPSLTSIRLSSIRLMSARLMSARTKVTVKIFP